MIRISENSVSIRFDKKAFSYDVTNFGDWTYVSKTRACTNDNECKCYSVLKVFYKGRLWSLDKDIHYLDSDFNVIKTIRK